MTTFDRYQAARRNADSVRPVSTQVCEVTEGNNDGYFITAFGLQYRFASVSDPKVIAQLFLDIVSVGPIETL